MPVCSLREDLHLANAAVATPVASVAEMIAATILRAIHTNIARVFAADRTGK